MVDVLKRAGLEVLGTADGALSKETAWRRVISGDAEPTATVDHERDGYLIEVETEWRRLAEVEGVVDEEGVFLISLPAPDSWESPWTVVRLTPTTSLAEHLADEHGELEFVTAALHKSVVLGVTTEESGIWLVVA